MSEDVLKSLEASERAAIEAVGQFLIAIEEALPQEVSGTSEVAKKVTEAGLEMVDRLVHAQHELLRGVLDSTARSLRGRNGVEPKPAE